MMILPVLTSQLPDVKHHNYIQGYRYLSSETTGCINLLVKMTEYKIRITLKSGYTTEKKNISV
jgi:hypothetical protein